MRYPMPEPQRIPPTWEPYLTGQVEAVPRGSNWVREQLTLYGILPAAEARTATRRHRRTTLETPQPTLPAVPPPTAVAPPRLGWPELRQWLDLYTTQLLGLNRAVSTLDGYRSDVEQFLAYCERQGLTPLDLTRVRLLSHPASLAQQGYQATSRARKTHAIKGFFQFLAEAELLPKNPFQWNCAVILSPLPTQLLQAELSSHEQGAFIVAYGPRVGCLATVPWGRFSWMRVIRVASRALRVQVEVFAPFCTGRAEGSTICPSGGDGEA